MKGWDLPFKEVFEILGTVFIVMGNDTQGVAKTLREAMGSWWNNAFVYRLKIFSENEMPVG